MNSVPTILAALGAITVLATAFGAFYALFRTKGRDATVEILNQTNDALKGALAWEKEQRQLERQACDMKIAELTGRMDTIQSALMQEVVGGIRSEISTAIATLTEAVRHIADERHTH